MLTRKGEAAPASTGTASTPKCHPGTPAKKPLGVSHSTPERAARPVVASRYRSRPVRDTFICLVAIGVVVGGVALAGAFADALPPVIVTVCGGLALIGIIMLVALREGRS